MEEKKYTKDYEQGARDAWECAKTIVLPKEYGGMSYRDLQICFGELHIGYQEIFQNMNVFDVLNKVKAYKKEYPDYTPVKNVYTQLLRAGYTTETLRMVLKQIEKENQVIIQENKQNEYHSNHCSDEYDANDEDEEDDDEFCY